MQNVNRVSFCIIVSLLFTIMSFSRCSKGKSISLPDQTIMPSQDTMITSDTTLALPLAGAKFLALGDSYTIGQSVTEVERFPAQTVQLLKAQNINVTDPVYIATTGWTTENLISAVTAENPLKDFDIVTLLIGVNDQYQNRDTTDYRVQFSELLRKSVDIAGQRKNHVFVLSIPDYSATPFVSESDKERVSRQIDEFNAINKEITLQNEVTYVDITPSTRQASVDSSLIANDNLHPSGKEYAVWANMLAPLIQKVLR